MEESYWTQQKKIIILASFFKFKRHYFTNQSYLLTMGEQQLISEFQNELRVFIRSKVKDYDISNDILQDVLLKIYQNYSKLKKKESLKSWLYQIARNAIIDHYRKAKFSGDLPSEIMHESISENTESEEQLLNCLQPFIHQLPDKYKEALLQTDLGGLSQKEYAQKTGLSYSGAKSAVQRARTKLRHLFEQCCQIEADKYGQILSYQQHNSCACS